MMNNFYSTIQKYNLGQIIQADSPQLAQLHTLARLLNERAMPAGFIGPCSPDTIYIRHILDSLLPVSHPNAAALLQSVNNVIDLGTGAGLPGLPLAIAFPGRSFTLTDSATGRLDFVRETVAELGLTNVSIVNCEADSLTAHTTAHDLVTFRAFRKPLASLEMALHVSRVGSAALYWRSQELDFNGPGGERLQALGWQAQEFHSLPCPPELGNRGFYIFKRVSEPPPPYPRPFKKIRKDGLASTFT